MVEVHQAGHSECVVCVLAGGKVTAIIVGRNIHLRAILLSRQLRNVLERRPVRLGCSDILKHSLTAGPRLKLWGHVNSVKADISAAALFLRLSMSGRTVLPFVILLECIGNKHQV
jgi:hypothetical protein